MLDQNTDRMWYVIGAVIIGAAIIFIMNSTFPQLFASVGKTFEDKTEDVGKVIDDLTLTDGVGPVAPNPNLIKNSDTLQLIPYAATNMTLESYADGWSSVRLPTKAVEFYTNTYATVKPNTEYTQSLYIRTDATKLTNQYFTYWAPVIYHHNVPATVTKVGDNLWRVVGVGSTRATQTQVRVPDISLLFEGGTYAEFGQYKLEEGNAVTPYVK